ncbi:MAG: hypothetical protein SFV17_03435 [Candidatus Obscuribacter sp.]|nr:hypothetical protein [Candidatus Melainabacteria bacterium]MDX1985719.1 hypothetical protein [Candidatus Obscuribacter sp.]
MSKVYRRSDSTTAIQVISAPGQPVFTMAGNWRQFSAAQIDDSVKRRYGQASGRRNHDWNCLNLFDVSGG